MSMTTLMYGPPVTTAPARRAWRWWQWLLLVLLTALWAALSGAATLLAVFAVGTTCDTPATVGTLRQGQLALAGIALTGALPATVLAVVRPPHRMRWATSALAAAAPPVYALCAMTRVSDWDGISFCF